MCASVRRLPHAAHEDVTFRFVARRRFPVVVVVVVVSVALRSWSDFRSLVASLAPVLLLHGTRENKGRRRECNS